MFDFLKRLVERATRAESLWSLFYLVINSSAFTWLASHWGLLESQGWAAVTIVGITVGALVTATVCLLVLAYRRVAPAAVLPEPPETAPRQGEAQAPAAGPALTPQDKDDEQAITDLELFIIDHVLPASEALRELQDEVVDAAVSNIAVRRYTKHGLKFSLETFGFNGSFTRLSDLHASPMPKFSLEKLCELITEIQKGYRLYNMQMNDFAEKAGVSLDQEDWTNMCWEHWRNIHNRLINEYEKIKRDKRFLHLYKPGRDSPWGHPVVAKDWRPGDPF